MKKYILIIFADYNTEKSITDLSKSLEMIVDSQYMKFHQTKGSIILHFGSEVSHNEIQDYLYGILYGSTNIFILTELNDNLTLCMSDELKAHFLDLENNSGPVDIDIDLTKMRKQEFEEEFTEDFVSFLLDEFHKEVKKPSLNDILDKINDKGLHSLTQFEKEILDNYSKKQS